MEKLVHKPTSNPQWNESFYFCFSDRKNKVNAMARLGFKPNIDEAMTFLLVFLPDGSVAGYTGEESINGEWGNHSLAAKGMRFTPHHDGSWSIQYEGVLVQVEKPSDFPYVSQDKSLIKAVLPTRMMLEYKPLHEAYEYSAHMTAESLEIGKKAGDGHWEQIGLVEGTLTLGEDTFHVSQQIGQRDHTYGVRDWTGVGDWLYYVVWFNESLAVNPAAIVMEDGRVSWGGFLYKDGVNQPIVEMRILEQRFIDDVIPLSSRIEIVTGDGETHLLEGKAGPVVSLPFIGASGELSVLSQSFGDFTLDGLTGGYGSFETLRVKN